MRFRFFNFKPKKEAILVLDIGTEAVKALIFEKKNEKVVVLGASLQYFDWFGVFDSRDFETDIIKNTVLKAVEEVQRQAGKNPKKVLLGLPANILKGKIVSHSLKRKNPKETISKTKEKEIYQQVLRESRKAICQQIAKESGILSSDIHFLSSEIIETRIDGYLVPNLYQYQGKKLGFKILASFLPIYYLENIQKKILLPLNFKEVKILHEAQNLQNFLLKETIEGIFIDVGGEITQIFLVKNGKIEGFSEFEGGGRFFSQSISQTLGLDEKEARLWKERYSRGLFSEQSRKKIEEILSPEQRNWLLNLNSSLKKINSKKLLPSLVFLFGGGSLLPGISEILEKDFGKDLAITSSPQVKFLYPKDLKNIEFKVLTSEGNKVLAESEALTLKNLQYVPSLLNCYAKI